MPPLSERLRNVLATRATALGRTGRVHPHDSSTGAFSLIGELGEERCPTSIVDGAGQHRRCQSLDVQVFDGNQSIAIDDAPSRLVVEVGALMRLLRRSLAIESKRCLANGVRLTIVGRRDRLPAALVVA